MHVVVNWFLLALDRDPLAGLCEHRTYRFFKNKEFLGQQNNHQHFKEYRTP
jgi:hypothetical protein